MGYVCYILGLAAYSLLMFAAAMWLRKHDAEPVSLTFARWKKANRLDKFASLFFTLVACVVFAVKPGNDRGANNESRSEIVRQLSDRKMPSPNLRDLQQSIAESDYEAGIILAEVRTNEVHDFTAPTNAIWQQDWLNFGGFSDNFRLEFEGLEFPFGTNSISALTVFQRGLMRPRTVVASSFIAPMQARLGVVPAYRHSLLPETNRPSGFWHCFTPSNSVIMTWRNFLLGQDSLCPVTLQAELFEDGCAEFRYDLSQAGAETITNIVAGIRCNSLGTTLDSLDANVTTILWQRLNPEDVASPDPDNDGISTCDEIFVYRTDPYNADSDYDGISDYDEINVHNSDPNDAHSINLLYCDSFALVLGDEDPFAYPEGSTNTIYEHIIYTGTTNAPFAYPVPTDEIGVLKIMVSGSGAGRLVVGDAVVPLLGSQTGLTRLTGLRSGANPDNPVTNTLLLAVGKGVRKTLWWEKPDGLDVALDSDDLLIGDLPTLLRLKGWIAFPHTKATVPCIHDLKAKGKMLTLVYGEEFSGLTALWQCASPSVVITNFPPVSADVHASFSTRGTTEISYTVDHPDRLNASVPSFGQTLEFCPKLTPEEETSLYGSPEEHSYTNMCHCVEQQGIVCGCCAYGTCNCPNPECPCYENPFIAPDETSEEDAEDEYDAITALPEALNVLQLHGNVSTQNVVHLDVPDEYRKCCSCPDHWTNHVALAYRSRRLSVTDASGADFSATNLGCNVVVRGLEPSNAPFDDAVLFSTNGASYLSRRYTALGVRMDSPCGYDTSVYNALSPSFGVPVTVNTNLDNAARFELHTDIFLSNGFVRVALENSNCGAQVWLTSGMRWVEEDGMRWQEDLPPVVLLGANGAGEHYFTMRQWRRILNERGSDGALPLLFVSPDAGRCDMVFSYATEHHGLDIKSSFRQRVSFINPPLLLDYDRGGRVNAMDRAAYLRGKVFPFWVNNDTWRGDDAFLGVANHISPPNLPGNDVDGVVNGRNDLVNFIPFAFDLSSLHDAWGSRVRVEVISSEMGLNRPRFALQDVGWNSVQSVALDDTKTTDGYNLHEATLQVASLFSMSDAATGILPQSFLASSGNGRGVVTMEFPHRADFVGILVRDSQSDDVLYYFELPVLVREIGHFIHWINLHTYGVGMPTSNGSPYAWPDDDEDVHSDAMVVFVHGYNVSPDEAWDWGTTVFKRLWRLGLDAGFAVVAWPGNEGQMWVPYAGLATPDYYRNAKNAFMTSSSFAYVCNALPGEKKYYIAHSLGNMLVSAAAQDWGLEYDQFFMLNAAVPVEAYDPSPATRAEIMTPDVWKPYERRVRPTCWYDLFPEGDGRRNLTWKGRFANVTNTVNYFSRDEEVVNNGDGKHRNPLRRNFVWHNQEYRKGWCITSSIKEGGWVFNPSYDVLTEYTTTYGTTYLHERLTPERAAALDDEAIRTNSFFGPFSNELIYQTTAGSALANDYDIRAEMLTHCIPSESFAVGANPVPAWGAEGSFKDLEACNIDMAKFKDGEADLPRKKRYWVHSYFINRSPKRTKELYESILGKINKIERTE